VLQYCTSSFTPEQQTFLGFDLVFAPDEHVFTVTAHFNNWNGKSERRFEMPIGIGFYSVAPPSAATSRSRR